MTVTVFQRRDKAYDPFFCEIVAENEARNYDTGTDIIVKIVDAKNVEKIRVKVVQAETLLWPDGITHQVAETVLGQLTTTPPCGNGHTKHTARRGDLMKELVARKNGKALTKYVLLTFERC